MKLVYETTEDVRRLKERLHGGYRPYHCDPGKDYLGRDFEVVIEFSINGSAEKYEAFLIPSDSGGHLKFFETLGLHDRRAADMIGQEFKNLVITVEPDLPDGTQRPTISTIVWLKRADNGPKGFGKFVYFSKTTGSFKATVAPRSWKDGLTVKRTFENHYVVKEGIQAFPQTIRDTSGQNLAVDGYFLVGDCELYRAFDSLMIGLSREGAWIGVDEGVELPLQIHNIFFVPIDYGAGLIQS